MSANWLAAPGPLTFLTISAAFARVTCRALSKYQACLTSLKTAARLTGEMGALFSERQKYISWPEYGGAPRNGTNLYLSMRRSKNWSANDRAVKVRSRP